MQIPLTLYCDLCAGFHAANRVAGLAAVASSIVEIWGCYAEGGVAVEVGHGELVATVDLLGVLEPADLGLGRTGRDAAF